MIPELTPLSFATDAGYGARARLGLIVLETDQTIEAEARALTDGLEGVTIYHSRIPMEPVVNPETLTAMAARLPAAAALLPNAFQFDAIGYGCTSAATLIGSEGVRECIESAHPGVPNTEPITAAIAAFHALAAERIAIITPYTADVTASVAERFATAGLQVTALGSFLESSDLVVARISPESIAAGVRSDRRTGRAGLRRRVRVVHQPAGPGGRPGARGRVGCSRRVVEHGAAVAAAAPRRGRRRPVVVRPRVRRAILARMTSAAHDRRTNLARRVRARELTVAPGVFDLVSARVADAAGFDALYMTGYGVSASRMGLPDAGLTSYGDMVDQAAAWPPGCRFP